MNRYRKLLGTSRGGHFHEAGKRLHYSSNRRRQSVKFRRRYAESIVQRMGKVIWTTGKFLLIAAAAGWIVGMAVHFCRQTNLFRVQNVVYRGSVPDNLRSFLPFKPGQNIFSMKPGPWEKQARDKFPEIKSISIRRTMARNIVVDVEVRIPVALSMHSDRRMGVDELGELFPLETTGPGIDPNLPVMQGASLAERKALAGFLLSLHRENTDLFSMVQRVEMERGEVLLTLRDQIQVEWGPVDEKNIFEKAKNILRLMSQYTPTKGPARLGFVTDNRVVMDSNWKVAPK